MNIVSVTAFYVVLLFIEAGAVIAAFHTTSRIIRWMTGTAAIALAIPTLGLTVLVVQSWVLRTHYAVTHNL
jgi:hypothetical protein